MAEARDGGLLEVRQQRLLSHRLRDSLDRHGLPPKRGDEDGGAARAAAEDARLRRAPSGGAEGGGVEEGQRLLLARREFHLGERRGGRSSGTGERWLLMLQLQEGRRVEGIVDRQKCDGVKRLMHSILARGDTRRVRGPILAGGYFHRNSTLRREAVTASSRPPDV